jgi:hypothetical protein
MNLNQLAGGQLPAVWTFLEVVPRKLVFAHRLGEVPDGDGLRTRRIGNRLWGHGPGVACIHSIVVDLLWLIIMGCLAAAISTLSITLPGARLRSSCIGRSSRKAK